MVFRLAIVHGPAASLVGRTLNLGTDPFVVGRAEDAGIALALEDPEVSRRHVELRAIAGGFELEDLGSHNGTYVNGVRLGRTLLTDGDVLRLGGSLLVFLAIEVSGEPLAQVRSEQLTGASFAMQTVRAEIALFARERAPVLVLGETGTGKELVARELHSLGRRAGAFVSVNCAALPESLVESELFGHIAGAFTGATRRSDGLFAAAHGGTLFLDEVGELAEAMQPKLLRALATGEVRAVGDSSTREVDVRVVAATHRDLRGDVDSGRFRADLYARLAGFTIVLPRLRDRRDDLLALAQRFLARGGAPTTLSANAAECLLIHDWPFNVRELEQAMAAVAVRARGARVVDVDALPEPLRRPIEARHPGTAPASSAPAPLALRVDPTRAPNAEELRAVLQHHAGNIARVAAFFGRSRKQIYRWAEEHGIALDEFRSE